MLYLPEVFENAVQSNSSSIALIEETNRWTFAELSDEVNRIAALLKETVPGDAVGVLLLNSQKYIATMLAIWKAGKTAVPLNYLLPPAELGFIIKDSGMSALVSSQFFPQLINHMNVFASIAERQQDGTRRSLPAGKGFGLDPGASHQRVPRYSFHVSCVGGH